MIVALLDVCLSSTRKMCLDMLNENVVGMYDIGYIFVRVYKTSSNSVLSPKGIPRESLLG